MGFASAFRGMRDGTTTPAMVAGGVITGGTSGTMARLLRRYAAFVGFRSPPGGVAALPIGIKLRNSAIGKSGKSFNNHWLTTISH